MDTIYLYEEFSTFAGLRCYKQDAEDRNDVTAYPVTIAEYKRLRRLAHKAHAGRDLYLLRCAREVMKALR